MPSTELYSFIFKGHLTKDAIDSVEGEKAEKVQELKAEELLALDAIDERFIAQAKNMSHVYTLIAAFENSVRELVSSTLKEEIGENWWTQCVSDKIKAQAQQRMEDEEKVRWHSPRGNEPINFTMLPN